MMDENERKAIFEELVKATRVNWFLHGDIPSELWLHFTDWSGTFDLPLLEKEKLLEYDSSKSYKPNGTWQDKFPPSAYRVTLLAWAILRHPSRWIFTGGVDLKKAETDRIKEWIAKKSTESNVT